MTDHAIQTLPELGGRTAGQTKPDIRHFFGAFPATPGDPIALDYEDNLGAIWEAPCCADTSETRLWHISSSARAVWRWAAAPVSPLNRTQILTPPAGTYAHDRWGAKLQIGIAGAGYQKLLTIDLGASLELYASQVSTRLLTWPDTVEVRSDLSPTAEGMVYDALVGVRSMQIEAPIGIGWAPLTQVFNVPSGVEAQFAIPTGAFEVTIYGGSSDAPAIWSWVTAGDFQGVGAPGLSEIGSLPFEWQSGTPDVNARKTFCCTEVPGNADFLYTDNVGSARQFTAVWKIRP